MTTDLASQRGIRFALLGFLRSVMMLLWYVAQGMPLQSLFRIRVATTRTTSGCVVLHVYGAALFTNWPSLRRRLRTTPAGATGVIVDLSAATVVDQAVRVQLTQLRKEWAQQHRAVEIIGLAP